MYQNRSIFNQKSESILVLAKNIMAINHFSDLDIWTRIIDKMDIEYSNIERVK